MLNLFTYFGKFKTWTLKGIEKKQNIIKIFIDKFIKKNII